MIVWLEPRATIARRHPPRNARISWANGLLDADGCRSAIDASIALLFDGLASR